MEITKCCTSTPKQTCDSGSAMSAHNSAVFNNACLKVPRNPVSQQPSPIYEQKYLNQIQNQARKLSLETKNIGIRGKYSPESDRSILKSLIEFYDSIPEYDDVNHLSNKDFHRKLQNLKEKQQTFYDYIQHERKCNSKSTSWIEDYKNLNIGDDKRKRVSRSSPKSAIKQFCRTPTLNKSSRSRFRNVEDVESILSSDKDTSAKPPSRRSVRIETPSENSQSPEFEHLRTKSRANISSAESKIYEKCSNSYNDLAWDDLSINEFRSDSDRELPLAIRSAPNSPVKNKCGVGWKENGITIPKPFRMTVRDEENKIVDDVILNIQNPKEEKSEIFRAHPIPIESRIPLFNKIVADQERRSEIVKRRSKEALRAQMRPFSFTRREEEIQALTKRLSKSSPSIFLDDVPVRIKQFRANPVPKALFSNYIYHKMHEDEFYRALQRKIRAEEMLRSSSLPPSMAKRERTKPKHIICPRSFRNLETESDLHSVSKPPSIPNYKASHDRLEKQLEYLKSDYITTSPTPFKFKTAKRSAERKLKRCYGSSRNSSVGSRNAENYRAESAGDLLSVNKSNLAAVLRIQSAKKKIQTEMCRKLEESKLREEMRWREKVLRKRPAWQALAYSHEEDLSMRLQLRRDEERLRSEEHRHRMELMFGRVNRMPMLFERQNQYKHYPVTREELVSKLHTDYFNSKYSTRYSSPFCLSDMSGKPLDVKEEEEERKILKEVLQDNDDEKEKCD